MWAIPAGSLQQNSVAGTASLSYNIHIFFCPRLLRMFQCNNRWYIFHFYSKVDLKIMKAQFVHIESNAKSVDTM